MRSEEINWRYGLKPLIGFCDRLISQGYLKFFREKNSLMTPYFQGILIHKSQIGTGTIHPESHGGVTIEHLRTVVEYFLSHNTIISLRPRTGY